MATFALMNIFEQLQPLVLFYASLENSSCASMDQLIINDGICTRSARDLPGLHLILGEDSLYQKISDWLRPRGCCDYHQNECYYWCMRCCFFRSRSDCFRHWFVSLRPDHRSPWA